MRLKFENFTTLFFTAKILKNSNTSYVLTDKNVVNSDKCGYVTKSTNSPLIYASHARANGWCVRCTFRDEFKWIPDFCFKRSLTIYNNYILCAGAKCLLVIPFGKPTDSFGLRSYVSKHSTNNQENLGNR